MRVNYIECELLIRFNPCRSSLFIPWYTFTLLWLERQGLIIRFVVICCKIKAVWDKMTIKWWSKLTHQWPIELFWKCFTGSFFCINAFDLKNSSLGMTPICILQKSIPQIRKISSSSLLNVWVFLLLSFLGFVFVTHRIAKGHRSGDWEDHTVFTANLRRHDFPHHTSPLM